MVGAFQNGVPVPAVEAADVVVRAPGPGPGNWAGAPSTWVTDEAIYLAYRVRRGGNDTRGYAVVVGASRDGLVFDTVATLGKDAFGAASLERPAIVRRPDGGWRLYVCCATPDSKHWWIDAIDADDPAGFDASNRVTVLPGDGTSALKDPVVVLHDGQWFLWVCRHPLDDPRATDRMTSWFATSTDGIAWSAGSLALAVEDGSWFQRGARIADVRVVDGTWVAYFDGRASAGENAEERTGLAIGERPDRLVAVGTAPIASSPWGSGSLRYVSTAGAGDGSVRLYFEAAMPDGSHALLMQRVGSRDAVSRPLTSAASGVP